MTGRCWFNFLVLYWQCEPGTNAFFCILSYILTLRYVTSGLKSNQTRTTASWSLETRRSKLHLSMLHLTHSACPLDSEISGCSKHCDKHASPKIQLLYCLYNQCGLVFLALCLMLQLLWSFEKEKKYNVWATRNHCSFTSSSSQFNSLDLGANKVNKVNVLCTDVHWAGTQQCIKAVFPNRVPGGTLTLHILDVSFSWALYIWSWSLY